MAEMKKPWNWDVMEVGEEYVYEYELTPELVRHYVDAMGIVHSWYSEKSPFGPPIVPPAWVAQLHSRLMTVQYAHNRGAIHTRIDAQFLKPVPVGSKVRAVGKLVDKSIKRGREYITYENRSFDEEGDEICREKRDILVRYEKREGA